MLRTASPSSKCLYPLEYSYAVLTVAFYLNPTEKSAFSKVSPKINSVMKVIIEKDLRCKILKVDYEIKMMNPHTMGKYIERNFSRLKQAENRLDILLGPSSFNPVGLYAGKCHTFLKGKTKFFTTTGRQLLKESKAQRLLMYEIESVKRTLDAQEPRVRQNIMNYPLRRTKKHIDRAETISISSSIASSLSGFCIPAAISTPITWTCSGITALLCCLKPAIGRCIPPLQCDFSYEEAFKQAKNELKCIETLSGKSELNNLLIQGELLKSQLVQLALEKIKIQRAVELNKMVSEKIKDGASVTSLISFFNKSGFPKPHAESKEEKKFEESIPYQRRMQSS